MRPGREEGALVEGDVFLDFAAHVQEGDWVDAVGFFEEGVEFSELGHGSFVEVGCCFGGFDSRGFVL